MFLFCRSSQENVPDVNNKEESKEDVPPPKPSRIPSKKYGTTTNATDSNQTSKSGNLCIHPHLY